MAKEVSLALVSSARMEKDEKKAVEWLLVMISV